MRSYTNRAGEIIEVSQEHLDVAVEIKRELQNASPSRRCNWSQHRKMMETEGFEDSENSEGYRQMIKAYQKSIGELPDAQKRAEMVTQSSLQSIKEAVGELHYSKREVQLENQKLNKLKRNLTKTSLITEEVRDAFVNDIDWSIPDYVHNPIIKDSDNKMILVLGDWHFGAVIENSNGNYYNFEVAKKRIELLKEKVVKYVDTFDVSEITIANIGDMIEGLYMRNFNQPFEAEFTLAEQISVVTKSLLDLIVSLSKTCNVNYFGIAGNHDRWFFEKNTVDADNAMKVINESIKTVIQMSKADRINYIEVDDNFNYEKVLKVSNKNFKFVHGDNEGKAMNIDKHISLEQEDIDCLIMGHYHYYSTVEGNYGKLNIINGSLMGRNSYSRKFKASSNASQTIVIVNNDEIIPIRVDLQVV